jgi:hypothetical protein
MYQTEGLGRLFIQQSEVICNTDTPAKSVTDIDQTEETGSLQTPRVVKQKETRSCRTLFDTCQICNRHLPNKKETRSLQTPAKQKETRSSRTLLI